VAAAAMEDEEAAEEYMSYQELKHYEMFQ